MLTQAFSGMLRHIHHGHHCSLGCPLLGILSDCHSLLQKKNLEKQSKFTLNIKETPPSLVPMGN